MKVKFLMDYKTTDFDVKADEVAEVKDELAELYIKNGVASFADELVNKKEEMTKEKLDELVKNGLNKLNADELKEVATFLGLEFKNKKQALQEITNFLNKEE